MKLTEAIIKRINELANANKITTSKWSMKAGITPTTMYGILKKTSGCPRVQTIKLLCDVIGITLGEFFSVDYIDTAEYEEEN